MHGPKSESYIIPRCNGKTELNTKKYECSYFPHSIISSSLFSNSDKGAVDHFILDLDMTNLLPSEVSLSANYPNPFNPSTKINFSINKPGIVSVTIFDILGKRDTNFI